VGAPDPDVADDWWVGFFDDDYVDLFAAAIDLDETERAVNDLITLVGVQPGWRVLDAPGGTGRHATPLAMLGCHVTVVDRAPAALAQARVAASRSPGDLRVVRADLSRGLSLDAVGRHGPPFDLVANLFNSFGYFATAADDQRLLRDLAGMVDRGGWFVMEVANPSAAIAQPRHERQDDRLGGAVVTIERDFDAGTGRLATRYRIEPDEGPVRTTGTLQRLWSPEALVAEAEEAGLDVVAVRGDLDGRPLTDETDWLVVVARHRRRRPPGRPGPDGPG
jgi:SAM-dependent methyltransferase